MLLLLRRRDSTVPFADTVIEELGASLVGYWKLDEASGTTAADSSTAGNNGTYQASGVTLGQPGIGDGSLAASFAGAGSVNVLPVAGEFTGDAFSIGFCAKVSAAADWTDGVIHSLCNWFVDSNNSIQIRKTTGSQLQPLFRAGGTQTQTPTVTTTTENWFFYVLTVDKNAGVSGELKVYFNGTAQATTTSLGTWAGTLTIASLAAASITGTNGWKGRMAHVFATTGALTAGQVTALNDRLQVFFSQ